MDYGHQDGQVCRQNFIYRITEGLHVILPELAAGAMNAS
jgi:hypothetical protein